MTIDQGNRFVVFDCDGTLVDSQHNIVAAMSRAFLAQGLPEPDPADVRRLVGLHVADAVAQLLPGAPGATLEAVGKGFILAGRALRDRHDHEEPLFPGVIEVLDSLAEGDMLLAVATGKSRRGLHRTLKRHGIGDRFVILKTADDGPGKPDPSILLDAMAEAGATPGSTAMIGDTVFDVTMARNANTYAIGVGWGYHQRHELDAAGAHVILDRFDDLPKALETLWSTA